VATNETRGISKQVAFNDINKAAAGFAPADMKFKEEPGFNLGFGLQSGKELPANIGTWSVDYTTKKKGEKSVKTLIPMFKCLDQKHSQDFTWASAETDLKEILAKMNCSDVFKSII